jgi:sugar phosphate isomerase/epimerase
MTPGIFARTFARPTVEEVLAAAALPGLRCVQFNFACAGLPTLPERCPEPALLERIRGAAARRGLAIAAVSGTWNMSHPDPAERAAGLHRLPALMEAACRLEAPVVTLCTGTRDPANMWRAHPENHTRAAWDDLAATLESALNTAARHGLILGVEPETANVVDSAAKARQLLDQFQGSPLGIIMDPANLLRLGDAPVQATVLSEAFRLLGHRLVLAHAKEWDGHGHSENLAVGEGQLDWDLYLNLLRGAGYAGPLVLHGFAEAHAERSAAFLIRKLATTATPG